MAVNLIDSTDISVSQTGSDIQLNINNKNKLGNVVVDSIKTKNMFNGNFTQGHHTSSTATNRICNVGLLPIKSVSGKSYTLSTNLPDTYKWKIMNCSTNQLNPTIYTDTTYTSSGSITINCVNDGYLIIIVGKTNDGNLTPSDVSSYQFQVEEGSSATTYTPFQDLDPSAEISEINSKLLMWGCEELGNKTSTFNANDCNIGQSFYWSIGSQPSNTPINAGRIYCFKGYGDANGKFQLCFSYLTNSTKMYIRTYFSGTWGAWYYITLTQN